MNFQQSHKGILIDCTTERLESCIHVSPKDFGAVFVLSFGFQQSLPKDCAAHSRPSSSSSIAGSNSKSNLDALATLDSRHLQAPTRSALQFNISKKGTKTLHSIQVRQSGSEAMCLLPLFFHLLAL